MLFALIQDHSVRELVVIITVELRLRTTPSSPNRRWSITEVVDASTALKGSSRTKSGALEYIARARASTSVS